MAFALNRRYWSFVITLVIIAGLSTLYISGDSSSYNEWYRSGDREKQPTRNLAQQSAFELGSDDAVSAASSASGGALCGTKPARYVEKAAYEQAAACRIMSEFGPLTTVKTNVQIKNKAFAVSLLKQNDIVSQSIRQSGSWEGGLVSGILDKLALVAGKRGHSKAVFIDIGANIGWFTVAVATQGFRVLSFEPMPQNEAVIRQSLCANPDIDRLVTYYAIGLGRKAERCEIWSDKQNTGDGHVECGAANELGVTDSDKYSLRAKIDVDRLEDVFGDSHLDDVAVIKLDVEGFEPNVIAGSLKWLRKAQPPYIVSEFVSNMIEGKNAHAIDYLKAFDDAGYDVHRSSWEGSVVDPSQFQNFITNEKDFSEIYLTSRRWSQKLKA